MVCISQDFAPSIELFTVGTFVHVQMKTLISTVSFVMTKIFMGMADLHQMNSTEAFHDIELHMEVLMFISVGLAVGHIVPSVFNWVDNVFLDEIFSASNNFLANMNNISVDFNDISLDISGNVLHTFFKSTFSSFNISYNLTFFWDDGIFDSVSNLSNFLHDCSLMAFNLFGSSTMFVNNYSFFDDNTFIYNSFGMSWLFMTSVPGNSNFGNFFNDSVSMMSIFKT